MDEAIVHVKQSYTREPRNIPVQKLFLLKYGTFPQKIRIAPTFKQKAEPDAVFHFKSVLDRLCDKHDINNGYSIVRRCFHPCSKKCFVREQLLFLSNIDGVAIYLNDCNWVTNYTNNSKESIQPDYIPDRHFLTVDEIQLFFLPEHEDFVRKLVDDLAVDETLILLKPKTITLRLIGKEKDHCNGPGAFYLTGDTYIKKPRIDNLALSYGGQDFLNIHEKIVAWLNKKDTSGLVLLHGAPGSGKTHYVRYLLHTIANNKKKSLIYVPGDMMNDLTNPTLIPLLLCHPNALLIIEDAEGSLSRSCTTSQSVANLLNISDGLLSDGIRVKILATFNCPLTSLDAALLRPGRLIAQYCFPSSLTIENARRLAEYIDISNIDQINEPLSLANIYAMREGKIEEEQDEATPPLCRKCSGLDSGGGEEE